MILPVTLTTAAAAALLNIWLSIRIGALRRRHKVSVGDGGIEALSRRMRAQLNFAENTPVVLILIAGIELARPGEIWLLAIGGLYVLGRIGHGLGMDGGPLQIGRAFGTSVTMLAQLVLGVWAVLIVAEMA